MRRKPHTTRRSVLTATGALSVLGLAGVASGDESGDGDATPDGDDVTTPADADEPTFPTIGDNDDAPTATVYSNLKCPYTEEFVTGNLEAIVDEFVATGRLNLRFCNLSYRPGDSSTPYISDSDPRIAAVELAVWDEDPDSYWQFFFEMYTDSPSGYVGYDELESRASEADVPNVDAVVERARAGEYDADVEEVAGLAGEANISFSPQLELAGETLAPHKDTQSVLGWIDARLEPAGAEDGAEDEESEEQPEEADEAADESQGADGESGSEYENTEYDGTDDDSDGDADVEDDTDAEDGADDSTDESAADDGPSFGDSDAGDGEIGAGMDYDLDADRTVDDLPIDCD